MLYMMQGSGRNGINWAHCRLVQFLSFKAFCVGSADGGTASTGECVSLSVLSVLSAGGILCLSLIVPSRAVNECSFSFFRIFQNNERAQDL